MTQQSTQASSSLLSSASKWSQSAETQSACALRHCRPLCLAGTLAFRSCSNTGVGDANSELVEVIHGGTGFSPKLRGQLVWFSRWSLFTDQAFSARGLRCVLCSPLTFLSPSWMWNSYLTSGNTLREFCQYLAVTVFVSKAKSVMSRNGMYTLRVSWESQQQKLNLILKCYWSENYVKYLTDDWYVEENYWICLVCESMCSRKLESFLLNYRGISVKCPHL
jgi:hypothetical protein